MTEPNEYAPDMKRVEDLYSWSVAWNASPEPEDRPDLVRLAERQRAEFRKALAQHDAEVTRAAEVRALREAKSDLAEMEHPDLSVVVGDPDNCETWETIPVTDWLEARADRIANADDET